MIEGSYGDGPVEVLLNPDARWPPYGTRGSKSAYKDLEGNVVPNVTNRLVVVSSHSYILTGLIVNELVEGVRAIKSGMLSSQRVNETSAMLSRIRSERT